MSDQGFREVQLSGKQVVFLFMAGAVALIGTFLLGVSVGRHVEPEAAAQQAASTPTEATTDPNPNAPLPPATTPAPGVLGYRDTLQGKPAAPTNNGGLASAQAASATPPATPPAATAPAKPTPSPTTSPKPASATDGDWFVQTDSFGTRENANKQQAALKAKNIPATVLVASGKTPYRVHVGPFDRAAAEAMKARLEKLGYTPRITR